LSSTARSRCWPIRRAGRSSTCCASGLVEESHPSFDARVRIYRLRPEPMAQLKSWLDETEQLWTQQLAAFKAHLESQT
jgi:hypothetical protein